MKNQFIAVVVITAIVVGGGAFFWGMKYATRSIGTASPSGVYANGGDGLRMRGGRSGGASGGFVAGNIIALDDKGITIELRSGIPEQNGTQTQTQGTGSKIVFVGSETQVVKTVAGSIKDLAVGDQVTVAGTANSDGSVTAQSIQIRPTPPVPGGQ
jgi:hypothetical protein